MLDTTQFRNLIRGGHSLFEVFEGRYGFYAICARWAHEWLVQDKFRINAEDARRLAQLVQTFDYTVFGISGKIKDQMSEDFLRLADGLIRHDGSSAGMAVAPFLFTWNIQRFKIYTERRTNFDSSSYFSKLGEGLEEVKRNLFEAARGELLSNSLALKSQEHLWEGVSKILGEIGIGQNEPVGTIKILHIFAPAQFPLWDNPIAENLRFKRKQESITKGLYLEEWIPQLRQWLQNYAQDLSALESECGRPILKLIDEALYLMISMGVSRRTSQLGLWK